MVLGPWCSSTRVIVAPAHWQEVLGAPALQRSTCFRINPIVCGLSFGREATGSDVAVVDVAVPHWLIVLKSAPSSCLPTWESSRAEPWSAHLHVLSEKKNHGPPMVVLGMCTRLLSMACMFEKVLHFGLLHQSNIPSTLWKMMGEVGCIRSALVPGRSTHW
jgi:hypothetical protein